MVRGRVSVSVWISVGATPNDDAWISATDGTDDCESAEPEGVKMPSSTDHLRRLRLDCSPVLRLVNVEADSDVRGLAGPPSSPDATELSKIASWGC